MSEGNNEEPEESTRNDEPRETLVNKEIQENETTKEDLYAYLKRDCYTTEKFKVEIRGLPKYYGIGEFKKFLNEKLQLNANKIKPPKRGSGWAYVCFRSNESRDKAINVLNGIKWKHAQLTAHVNIFISIIFILLSVGHS
jgi:tRNA (uracil-5-)-methyltransferase